jgi:hypothetical protein
VAVSNGFGHLTGGPAALAVGFTRSMLSDRTFILSRSGTIGSTLTFNADGTMAYSPETWTINVLGQLVYQEVTDKVPDNIDVFTLLSSTGTVFSSSVVQTYPDQTQKTFLATFTFVR